MAMEVMDGDRSPPDSPKISASPPVSPRPAASPPVSPRGHGSQSSSVASLRSSRSMHSNGGFEKPRRWIQTTKASTFFGGAILLNAILLGVETDYGEQDESGNSPPFWVAVDLCFTFLFLAECMMRVEAERWRWHRDMWNVLDGLLVLLGLLDFMFLIASGHAGDARILQVARLLRLLRISRLGKVLGLLRYVKELLLLVSGFWTAVKATFWAMLLFLLVLFVTGLFVTRLVGQSCCEPGDAFRDPRYKEWFGTVPKTIFTLFTCATLEGWPAYARASLVDQPLLAFFLIVFVVLSNMMLLQVVTAIVIEHVMDVSLKEEMDELTRLEQQQTQRLYDLFEMIDTNQDGKLSFTELTNVLQKKRTTRRPNPEDSEEELDDSALLDEALRHAKMSKYDAQELFRALDMDDSGELSKIEFLEGMVVATVPPKPREAVLMSIEVSKIGDRLRKIIGSLREVDSFLQALPELDAAPASGAQSSRELAANGREGAELRAALAQLREEVLRAAAEAEARLREKAQRAVAEARRDLDKAFESLEKRLDQEVHEVGEVEVLAI